MIIGESFDFTELPAYAEPMATAAWLATTIAREHGRASEDSPLAAALFTNLLPLVLQHEGGAETPT